MPQTVDLTQDTDNPAFLLHYRDQIQSRISRLYYSLQYLVRSLALAINPHFCCAHNALLALSTCASSRSPPIPIPSTSCNTISEAEPTLLCRLRPAEVNGWRAEERSCEPDFVMVLRLQVRLKKGRIVGIQAAIITMFCSTLGAMSVNCEQVGQRRENLQAPKNEWYGCPHYKDVSIDQPVERCDVERHTRICCFCELVQIRSLDDRDDRTQ
jgi:hypothetical protein